MIHFLIEKCIFILLQICKFCLFSIFYADGKDSKEQGYSSSPGSAKGKYICK